MPSKKKFKSLKTAAKINVISTALVLIFFMIIFFFSFRFNSALLYLISQILLGLGLVSYLISHWTASAYVFRRRKKHFLELTSSQKREVLITYTMAFIVLISVNLYIFGVIPDYILVICIIICLIIAIYDLVYGDTTEFWVRG